MLEIIRSGSICVVLMKDHKPKHNVLISQMLPDDYFQLLCVNMFVNVKTDMWRWQLFLTEYCFHVQLDVAHTEFGHWKSDEHMGMKGPI